MGHGAHIGSTRYRRVPVLAVTPPLVSGIVIAQNEEHNIARCLNSLRWVDQLIVIDAMSFDNTVPIARAFGADVYVREWPGYVAQQRYALSKAEGTWVISLDADEELEPGLVEEIQAALSNVSSEISGFDMPRKCLYLGKWIRHGEWYPDRKLRLIRRSKGRVIGENPHYGFSVIGNVGSLDGHILHYSYVGVIDHFRRMQRYSTLMAENMYRTGVRWSVRQMILEPATRAVRNYVQLAGYRDGYQGILISIFIFYYVFRKHFELCRLQRAN
ncbi:glycosyltransferase family 2 protein [Pseudomonadota bacterium]